MVSNNIREKKSYLEYESACKVNSNIYTPECKNQALRFFIESSAAASHNCQNGDKRLEVR